MFKKPQIISVHQHVYVAKTGEELSLENAILQVLLDENRIVEMPERSTEHISYYRLNDDGESFSDKIARYNDEHGYTNSEGE
jgi:hypothetical protein